MFSEKSWGNIFDDVSVTLCTRISLPCCEMVSLRLQIPHRQLKWQRKLTRISPQHKTETPESPSDPSTPPEHHVCWVRDIASHITRTTLLNYKTTPRKTATNFEIAHDVTNPQGQMLNMYFNEVNNSHQTTHFLIVSKTPHDHSPRWQISRKSYTIRSTIINDRRSYNDYTV